MAGFVRRCRPPGGSSGRGRKGRSLKAAQQGGRPETLRAAALSHALFPALPSIAFQPEADAERFVHAALYVGPDLARALAQAPLIQCAHLFEQHHAVLR